MANPSGGVIVATFRDRLRGAIKGHENMPSWACNWWFTRNIAPVLLADDADAELVKELAQSRDGSHAIQTIEAYLAAAEPEPSFTLEK